VASSEFHREGDLALAKTCPTRTITVAYQLHLSRFTGKAAYSIPACRFSSSMSNSQMKCPTHVQLDKAREPNSVEQDCRDPGRSSTGRCTDGIRALVLSRLLEPRIAPGS